MKLYDQFHFQGNYQKNIIQLFFTDVDGDDYSEMWGFTTRNDSIFLNAIEPFDSVSPFSVTLRYLDKICRKYYKKDDLSINFGAVTDINGDGHEEFVFYLRGGYSIKPRKLYIYYPGNDKLQVKELPGLTPTGQVYFKDLTGDGKKEILLSSYASCNVHDSLNLQFSDQNPWLITLTSELDYLHPPVAYEGGYSRVLPAPVKANEKHYILLAYGSKGADGTNNRLELRNLEGELVRQHNLNSESNIYPTVLSVNPQHPDEVIIFDQSGNLHIYNSDLQNVMTRTFDLPFLPTLNLKDGDFIQDIGLGKNGEIIGVTLDRNTVVALSGDYKHTASYVVDKNDEINSLVPYTLPSAKKQLWAIGNKFVYKLDYGANPLYYWQYIISLAIFCGALLFILAIRKLYERQLREKYELKNQVERLKLKSLQNQLDPHFVLNTTNSIGSVILAGDATKAYKSFVRFSNLMRLMLRGNDRIFITLRRELDFVAEYMHFQKMRLGDKLTYHMEVDDAIKRDMMIPKMIIYIHAENAVKHGVFPSLNPASLTINLQKSGAVIRITIRDNGIGREAARAMDTRGNGVGLKLLTETYQILNRINETPIRQTITDLYDTSGHPAGTKVVIEIPVNLKVE